MNLDIGDTRKIIQEALNQGVLRNQLAYILATAYWETNKTMQPVREAYWLSESWRRRNLRYYPYYGRGYVQLTWETNYRKASKVFGVDFVKNPDKVMKPEYATKILVMGSMEGWFTGKKISDYITLQTSDFYSARRVINGLDKAKTIAEIAKDYDNSLLKEGYGVDKPKKKINFWERFKRYFRR